MKTPDKEQQLYTTRPASFPFDRQWALSAAVRLACTFEATAPKVGNVHPGASFGDMDYGHFLESAVAVEPVFQRIEELSVGGLVLESVKATRARIGINTNLGTALLLAPLAKAHLRGQSSSEFHAATQQVLAKLTHCDSLAVYEAIRMAKPGGLGNAAGQDVRDAAPPDLIGAMRQAAAVDAVARQYANGFADLFGRLVPWFDEAIGSGQDVFMATCEVQVRWLATEPDGLIVRKCGESVAAHVQFLAMRVVQETQSRARHARLCELDNYLRGDAHRRNPGTTADLMAATLFIKLMCFEELN